MDKMTVQKALEMLSPDYDWNKHWDHYAEGFESAWREVTETVINPWPCGFYECGAAARIKDGTAAGLYRLLWLCQPNGVDFSDMCKTYLFAVVSKDHRFLVSVELFKYELGLYFHTSEKELLIGRESWVVAGHPGANNGVGIQDPDGLAFFELVTKAALTQHEVYAGNNFVV